MKITGAYIDGFGVFHDLSISGLDRDIVLFYGCNEAGKSTFLGFIRSILFGFPRANSRDSAYPPHAGGVHGGRIDLRTESGEEWSVSRKPGVGGGTVTVTGSDGTTRDKATLDQLLGGIPYEAFRNIMAFGLTELQSIDTLSSEHVASAIYGAGLGTSMMAMPRARKAIHDQMARLFLKNGSKPVLNRIAGDLDRIRSAIHDASLQSARYDAACDAMARVEKEVSSCRNELSRCRREQQQYEALERLWPDWISFRENHGALNTLGEPTAAFPEGGLPELEHLSEARERSRAALSELIARQERIAARMADLPVDDAALARAGAIGLLVENRNANSENIQQLPLLMQEKRNLDDAISRSMQRLGSRWNEAAALAFDRSLFTRETIRKHQVALEGLERRTAAIEALLADRRSTLDQAAEARMLSEKEVAEKGELPKERDPDLVRKLEQGRDRFADNLRELKRISSRLDEAEASLLLLRRTALEWSSGSKWPVVAVAGAGLAAAGLTAYFASYRDAAALLGAAVVAAWATWVYRRQQRQLRRYRQDQARQQQLRVEELREISLGLESERAAYTDLAMELLGPAENGADRGEVLLATVDRLISNLSQEKRRREAVLAAAGRLLEREKAEAAARHALEKVVSDRNDLAGQHAGEKSAWEKRCGRLGLSGALSPATALEALDIIEQTVETIQSRDRCQAELSRREEEIDDYRKRGIRTLLALGQPAAANDLLPQRVADLAKLLEESKLNKREKETLGRELANTEKERAGCEQALRRIESGILALLKSADTPDEASFRSLGERTLRRAALLAAADAAERNMRRISGELDTTRLAARLASLSLTEIRDRKEAAVESIQDLDSTLSALYTQRAGLSQTLETLSSSDEMIRLRAEEADRLADLKAGAREWSRYALADHLLSRAREVFEKKHQPRILLDAGAIFSRMTGSKYQGVVAPLGENTLSAVDRNGERVPPGHLSRGTAEQLYLAVRFSYIRHQVRRGDSLPVIMDDILVNFDPSRARRAAEEILNLSSSHQVLLFTCHPETLAVFQEIDPRIPVYRMEERQLVQPEKHPDSEKKQRL